MGTDDKHYSIEEIEKLLKEGKRRRHLRAKFDRPGLNDYIRKWLPIILSIGIGMLLQKTLGPEQYLDYPPRKIEGERVQRYKDSIYYMKVIIDSAFHDFGN